MHRPSPFALGLLGWLREAVFFLLGAWLAAPARLGFASWALLIALLITYPATLQAYQDHAKRLGALPRPVLSQPFLDPPQPAYRSPRRDDLDWERPHGRPCPCHER